MFIEDEVVVNSWWSNIFGLYLLIISARIIQIIVYPGQFHFEVYWQHLFYLNFFSYKNVCINITTNNSVISAFCILSKIHFLNISYEIVECLLTASYLLRSGLTTSKKDRWDNLALHLYLFN